MARLRRHDKYRARVHAMGHSDATSLAAVTEPKFYDRQERDAAGRERDAQVAAEIAAARAKLRAERGDQQ